MKPPKNYKQIIKKSIQEEWHCLGKRTTPPIFLWLKMIALSNDEMQKLYNARMPGVVICQKPFTEFYIRSKDYRNMVEKATPILFSIEKIKKRSKQIKYLSNQAKKQALLFYRNDLYKLTNQELLTMYNKMMYHYTRPLLYGFVTWCTQVFSESTTSIIRKKRKEVKKLGLDEKSAFGILVAPCKQSPYTKKENALDKLTNEFKKSKIAKSKSLNKKQIKNIDSVLHKKIMGFLEKYQWLGYDYSGPEMTYKEVLEIIMKRKNERIKKLPLVSRSNIIRACKLTNFEKNIFNTFSILTYIKDLRNSGDDFIHFCLINYFFKEIGRRFNLTKEAIQYLWPEELENMLTGKKRYTKKYIQKKAKCLAATTILENGFEKYKIGEEAKQFAKKVINPETNNQEIKKFNGTIACPGLIKARVKIVYSFDELNKVKYGDILVTHMTSPRFMSAIKICSAIITDEGGLTCHAAIIAREMNKPCIIGTKIATQVLKDGDLVEVDAERGMVKILEKNKI